jgi:hypothetical protein
VTDLLCGAVTEPSGREATFDIADFVPFRLVISAEATAGCGSTIASIAYSQPKSPVVLDRIVSDEKRVQDAVDRPEKLVGPTASRRAAVVEARTAAAAIEREWARLSRVNRARDPRNLLERLHDAPLRPPNAEE